MKVFGLGSNLYFSKGSNMLFLPPSILLLCSVALILPPACKLWKPREVF